MSKKKILHITSSLKMGGAETVLYTIITNLKDYDHEVLYVHDGPFVQKLRDAHIPLHHVRGLVSSYDPIFLLRVIKQVKKIKPDYIHSLLWLGNCAGIIAGRLLKIPIVSSFHNNVDQNGGIRNGIDRLLLPYAQQLIAVSDQVKQSVYQQHPKLRKDITVIRNGISCDVLQRDAHTSQKTRAALGIPDTAFLFGSVGRFESVKRYDYLIKVFAQLRARHTDIYLALVGVGSQSEYLKKCARESGVGAHIIFIEGQQAIGYYSLFDCFIQSTAKEGVSMALLEAMGLGIPCVVTNEGRQHEVVLNGDNGLVVDAYDAAAFEKALECIILNKDLARVFSENGRKRIYEDFDLNFTLKSYDSLFV
jgi:glycosyltransferase involved in cell wall biosynthesis